MVCTAPPYKAIPIQKTTVQALRFEILGQTSYALCLLVLWFLHNILSGTDDDGACPIKWFWPFGFNDPLRPPCLAWYHQGRHPLVGIHRARAHMAGSTTHSGCLRAAMADKQLGKAHRAASTIAYGQVSTSGRAYMARQRYHLFGLWPINLGVFWFS